MATRTTMFSTRWLYIIASTDMGITFFLRHSPKVRQLIRPILPGMAWLRAHVSLLLKFFFDGNFVIPNPVVPSSDGLSLRPYTGGDAGQITVNGELNKLAHNISFGHGIHSGIHWRSDTDSSIQQGEAVAISILQDRAQTYNERFTVSFTKIDGTTATISNQ